MRVTTRVQARLSLGLLIGLSLASSAFWWLVPTTVPSPDELTAAAERIARDRREGDAVLLLPPYADGARRWMPEGIEILALPPDDPDLAWVRRLWVVAQRTLPGADTKPALATLADRFGSPEIDALLGHVRLLRFSPPGPWPRFHLSDVVAQARVTLDGRPCRFRPAGRRSARHVCPVAPWTYVGAQTREIDYLPRRCVWAHPTTAKVLRIEVPAPPGPLDLHLRAGIVGEMALRREAASVTIRVREGQRPLGTLVVQPRPGLQRARFALPARPTQGPPPGVGPIGSGRYHDPLTPSLSRPRPLASPSTAPAPAPAPSPSAPSPSSPAPAPVRAPVPTPSAPSPSPPPLVLEITTADDGGRHLCLDLLGFDPRTGEAP